VINIEEKNTGPECGNNLFDLVIMEPPASKEGFQMREQMKITWRYVSAVGADDRIDD
jgi:hypothetical protein